MLGECEMSELLGEKFKNHIKNKIQQIKQNNRIIIFLK